MKKNDGSLWVLGEIIKATHPVPLESQQEKRGKGNRKHNRERMAKNFPNLGRKLGIPFLRLIGHPNISSRNGFL